jgi:outer membrane immunogenic protein
MRILSVRVAAVAFAACISQAADRTLAADLQAPVTAPAPMFTWSGLYLGGHGGYGAGTVSPFDPKGGFAGGQAGYNYQLGNWVIGVEGDGAWASMTSKAPIITLSGAGTATFKDQTLATIRGRFGFAAGNLLFYATGGAGWAQGNLFSSALVNVAGDAWHSGWAGGGGVEWAFLRDWSAKIEYMYYGLHGATYPNFVGVVTTGNQEINTVKVGINYLLH